MNLLNKDTKSLCNICYSEVPAYVYEENGQVFISKKCSRHGEFKELVEKDADFYKWFIKLPHIDNSKFKTLYINITYRCNMNCKYCFSWFPEKSDLALNEILEAVKNFQGSEIVLSGGEPTLRDDLEEIIAGIKKLGKITVLATNGLKLADINYLRRLKSAGLNSVVFSFDSFQKSFYDLMKKGQTNDVFEMKNKALANLEKEKVRTTFSSTIYPGLNENEIKDLLFFALKKDHFIIQIRFRSCVNIGRNKNINNDGFFLSELFGLLSSQAGVDKGKLKSNLLVNRMGRSVTFRFCGHFEKAKFVLHYDGDANNHGKKSHQHDQLVKIVRAPTVGNIDLNELKTPMAYLYNKNQVLKFFHGLIMEEKPDIPD